MLPSGPAAYWSSAHPGQGLPELRWGPGAPQMRFQIWAQEDDSGQGTHAGDRETSPRSFLSPSGPRRCLLAGSSQGVVPLPRIPAGSVLPCLLFAGKFPAGIQLLALLVPLPELQPTYTQWVLLATVLRGTDSQHGCRELGADCASLSPSLPLQAPSRVQQS